MPRPCQPPSHTYDWSGAGAVSCSCGATTAELIISGDGTWETRLVEPTVFSMASSTRERRGDLHIEMKTPTY